MVEGPHCPCLSGTGRLVAISLNQCIAFRNARAQVRIIGQASVIWEEIMERWMGKGCFVIIVTVKADSNFLVRR